MHARQVSRPGFWSITLWLYLLPTGGGAGGTNTGGAALMGCSFWAGLVFCGAPLNLMVYLWNDLVDQDTDRVNPRKGAPCCYLATCRRRADGVLTAR